MIVRGKFNWYAPEKTMSAGAASLFNKIGGLKELPHVSSSIMEIQEALNAVVIDVPLVAKKIKGDALLAAMLLETANNIKISRQPGDRNKIDSLEHAIMFVGKKACSELVMTISLKAFETKTLVFKPTEFWKDSFITSDLAELIAQKWGDNVSRDEVFVSAALCNIGKIVGAIALPQDVDKIEALVGNPKTMCTWPQAEARLKLPNHSLLGELGAALWGLPKYVLEAIASHHAPVLIDPGTRPAQKLTLEECVGLANQLSHWIMLRPSRIDQPTVDKICMAANISASELDAFAEKHRALGKRAA